jgi:hypothetical protein
VGVQSALRDCSRFESSGKILHSKRPLRRVGPMSTATWACSAGRASRFLQKAVWPYKRKMVWHFAAAMPHSRRMLRSCRGRMSGAWQNLLHHRPD